MVVNFWVKIFIKSSLFLIPPNFKGFVGLNKGFSCFVSFSSSSVLYLLVKDFPSILFN